MNDFEPIIEYPIEESKHFKNARMYKLEDGRIYFNNDQKLYPEFLKKIVIISGYRKGNEIISTENIGVTGFIMHEEDFKDLIKA